MEHRVESAMTADGHIECKDISKSYRAATGHSALAVDGLTLDIEPNEFVMLLGPSGCGKSTLLNIIAGFEKADTGEVLLDGKPILRPGPDRGMVFQDYALFPWLDVRKNVEYGLHAKGIRGARAHELADRYLSMAGLKGFESRYPHELSGGMRQRVALCRVLAIEPAILLMDEPFAAVDAQTRTILQAEVERIWLGSRKTVVFVTHSVDEAIFLGDRIVVMTARPGTIKALIAVDLPRPRDPSSSEFNTLRAQVTKLIEQESVKAFRLSESMAINDARDGDMAQG
jgi:NitT/TauT family transport system ATP-binding protein